MSPSQRILILDDHLLFAEGLAKIILDEYPDIRIETFRSISELKGRNLEISRSDVILSDIELPGEDIFKLIKELKELSSPPRVLVISMHNKLSVIRKCKEMGVEGYILKEDYHEVHQAIEDINNNKTHYSEKVQKTLEILNKKEKLLTPKEEEIIALVSQGKSNQEISDQLFISYNTVKTHRKNILRKLELNNTAELTRYYMENYL